MKASVLINLDKPRTLRFNMTALSLIEDTYNKPISDIFKNDLAKEFTIRKLATFLWAGLRHEDKELTAEKIIEFFDDAENPAEKMKEASEVLGKAMTEAFGKNL